MDQLPLMDQVDLSRQAVNALLDVRYNAEGGAPTNAQRFPRYVVRELVVAGVVTHVAGFLALTDRGRTCGIRNLQLGGDAA